MRGRRLLFFLALSTGVILGAAAASGPPAWAPNPEFLASTLWSDAHAVRVIDDVAFVSFRRGLATFDLSDPTEPALLQRFEDLGDPWVCHALEVVGDLAYVAAGSEGLKIYDLSDPASPVLLGACDTPGEARDLAIAGDLAYIADGYGGGVQIVRISNPAHPELLGGCLTAGECFSITLSDHFAYCADGLEGIAIVDVTDPSHPQLRGSTLNTYYPPYRVRAERGFLYSVGSEGAKSAGGLPADKSIWDPSGLSIQDLSDPLAPALVGTYQSNQGANSLAVRGSLVYLANANATVTVIDVSVPQTPTETDQVETGGYSHDIHLVADRAYVSASKGCLAVLDLAVPTHPVLLGRWWESSVTYDVAAYGGFACVADRDFGLHVVDARDPEGPRILSDLELPRGPWSVVTDGSFAYAAADSSGVFVIDLSDPETPVIAGHLAVLANDLDLDRDRLCAVSRGGLLHVIDVSDPTQPVLAGSCDFPGSSLSVSARGRYGCISAGSALYVVDLVDPGCPTLRGAYDPQEYIHQVSFDGVHAYASLGNNGLQVIDVSDPDAPACVADLRLGGNTRGSCLLGNRLYLGAAGLQVIDVSDPTHPVVVGSGATVGTNRVCVDEGLAFTADGGSLGIFRLDPAASTLQPPQSTTAAGGAIELRLTNPLRPGNEIRLRLGRAGPVRVELFDVLGRRAAVLYDAAAPAGDLRFRCEASRLVAGRYSLRAATPEGEDVRPVLLLP